MADDKEPPVIVESVGDDDSLSGAVDPSDVEAKKDRIRHYFKLAKVTKEEARYLSIDNIYSDLNNLENYVNDRRKIESDEALEPSVREIRFYFGLPKLPEDVDPEASLALAETDGEDTFLPETDSTYTKDDPVEECADELKKYLDLAKATPEEIGALNMDSARYGLGDLKSSVDYKRKLLKNEKFEPSVREIRCYLGLPELPEDANPKESPKKETLKDYLWGILRSNW